MSSSDAIPYGFEPWRKTFTAYRDNRHLISFGPTRSGKGATVIVQTLLMAGHSIICIDPKGQNAAITARRRRELGQDVHFLNPFNELGLGGSRFNPLAHLRIDQPNIVADVRSLADALIIPNSKDPHWTDSAVDLLHALLLHLVATKGGEATLPEMRRLLTLPAKLPEGESFALVVAEMLLSDWPFVRQAASRFMNFESREIQSILSTAITQTFFLDDPNIATSLSGNDFSMMQLKETPTTVFLILPGRYIEAYARFLRLVVTSAIDQLTTNPGGHKTLFILDEFATLQNLPAVAKAFGFAAGYNVQMWPFLQDLPQLKFIYGDKWESFLANAGLVQFFTPADLTTADYIHRRCGEKTERRESFSLSEISKRQAELGWTGIGRQYADMKVPLLALELILGMSPESQIVFFGGVQGARVELRFPYWRIKRLAGMFDPDPFHTGATDEPVDYVEDVGERQMNPKPKASWFARLLSRLFGR